MNSGKDADWVAETFVVAVWSLSVGLSIAVFGLVFVLLQLIQGQLPPAAQRRFAHPIAVATATHTHTHNAVSSEMSHNQTRNQAFFFFKH